MCTHSYGQFLSFRSQILSYSVEIAEAKIFNRILLREFLLKYTSFIL